MKYLFILLKTSFKNQLSLNWFSINNSQKIYDLYANVIHLRPSYLFTFYIIMHYNLFIFIQLGLNENGRLSKNNFIKFSGGI
jgi:hypothetical protein